MLLISDLSDSEENDRSGLSNGSTLPRAGFGDGWACCTWAGACVGGDGDRGMVVHGGQVGEVGLAGPRLTLHVFRLAGPRLTLHVFPVG